MSEDGAENTSKYCVEKENEIARTYRQNEQREVAIHSSQVEANRKMTRWTPKMTVDGQHRKGAGNELVCHCMAL